MRLPGRLGARVWWRQLIDARRVALVVAGVVVAGAVFIAGAPRVLEVATVDDLRDTLQDATPEERNIRFVARTEIGAGAPGVPFSNIEWIGGQLRDENIPPSVLELIADEQWIFDTPQFVASTYPGDVLTRYPPTFRFREQSGLEDHMTVIDGALPKPRDPELRLEGSECPEAVDDLAAFEPDDGQDCRLIELRFFETAMTPTTASEFGMALGDKIETLGDRTVAVDGRPLVVGDRFMLRPDQTQLGFRTAHFEVGSLRLIVEVSGIIELSPPDDEFWYADVLLHRPRIRENNDFEFVFAAGLLGGEQYRGFRSAAPGTGLDFSWRHLVDPELVEDTDSEQLVADLQRIAPADADVVTQLPELLQGHLAQRRLTLQVWSMVALAFAAAAVAATATLARAEAVRRSAVHALQEGRGASRLQLFTADAATAATVVALPTAIGVAIAALAFPATDLADSVAAAGAFAAVGALAYVLAGRIRTAMPGLRRVLARAVLVIAAFAVVGLLRRRETGVDDAVQGELDPTLMVAPVLLIATVAVLGTDLLGPLSKLVAGLSARARGAIWFVGLRRVATNVATIRGPLLAVVMATALAVVAAVLGSSIESGQDAAARQVVGAEARVGSTLPAIPLPTELVDELERSDIDASFGTALAFQRFEGDRGGFVADLVAIDGAGVVGAPGAPIGVELIGPWQGAQLPDVGETFVLELNGFVVPLIATDRADHREGIRVGVSTVVLDRAAFAAATTDQLAAPDFALVEDTDAIGELRVLVDGRPAVDLSTRADELDRLAGDPLSTWTSRGLRLAATAGLGLAMIAAFAASVIHAVDRRRDLGLVAVLGGTRRAAVRMALAELTPTYAGAAGLGILGGVLAVRTLGPNLTFEAFADGAITTGVVVDGRALVLVVLAIGVVLGLALGAAARTIRRLDHAMMLREGNR